MYLILDRLVKKFTGRGSEEVVAVDNLSLTINKGEFVTLLGPSGCGKTTTLRLIAGFEFPTEGTISLDGRVINNIPPNKRDMAMVFQSYAIFPHLSVYENIAYGLRVKKVPEQEMRQRIKKVLELTELLGLENRAPNQLSGGQQQRVALARALVMEPKVLLFDEPLSNLDAKLREQMRAEIRRIQQRLQMTSVYVTHDQAEAMTLSDRIVVMNKGRIEQVGTAQEIYRHPRSAFVADFIGRANFIEARVESQSNTMVDLIAFGQRLTVARPAASYSLGKQVTLVVRPEAIELSASGQGFEGKITRMAYLGAIVDYDVMVDGQRLSVVTHDPRQREIFPEGATVKVRFLEDCLYILPAP